MPLIQHDFVQQELRKLDPKKATGPDKFSAKLLKQAALSLSPVLTRLINKSINTGKFPSSWKLQEYAQSTNVVI